MPSRKFKVEDIVAIKPTTNRFVPGGAFAATKQLPGNNEPEYPVKSVNEPHERVALAKAQGQTNVCAGGVSQCL
jgi:hypothetical protein